MEHKIEWDGHEILVTTESTLSSYGDPVILVDGDCVAASFLPKGQRDAAAANRHSLNEMSMAVTNAGLKVTRDNNRKLILVPMEKTA
jgi:hypothetical protein